MAVTRDAGPSLRIAICDDHAVFAESLALVLAETGHEVVAVTGAPAELAGALRAAPAEICLLDLNFPAGTALHWLPELRAAAPVTRFVLLTGFLDGPAVEAGLKAGVRGFADKGQQAADILAVLRRVHAGEVVRPGRVARRPARRPRTQAQRAALFLTPREREVLTRLTRGESTAALAKAMGVTRATARSHVQSVLTKLGVHSQREAVVEAARHGLVSIETGEWIAR